MESEYCFLINQIKHLREEKSSAWLYTDRSYRKSSFKRCMGFDFGMYHAIMQILQSQDVLLLLFTHASEALQI